MSNRKKNLYDPGCIHNEDGFVYQEATIALQYGLTLRDAFRAKGIDVFMTRDDEHDHCPVGLRAQRAEAANCEVFLSLHLNDVEDDSANGFEILYRDDSFRTNADKLADDLATAVDIRRRASKQRLDLAVLKFEGPAFTVELGFIANDGNRATLLDTQKRSLICERICESIIGQFVAV